MINFVRVLVVRQLIYHFKSLDTYIILKYVIWFIDNHIFVHNIIFVFNLNTITFLMAPRKKKFLVPPLDKCKENEIGFCGVN
jgi:hypothetical protein